ncbi:unannotated protein [freshwater metagenome]|uniref:Unannotated protein n=1 Tax=freshwater metagenome TaxID=449393 RepID=A0A6J6EN14_9ZZZZ
MTAHRSQFINREAITAGASGNKYECSGFIFLSKKPIAIKQPIKSSTFISKNQRYEFSAGTINEINQLPNPIIGGYSIALSVER